MILCLIIEAGLCAPILFSTPQPCSCFQQAMWQPVGRPANKPISQYNRSRPSCTRAFSRARLWRCMQKGGKAVTPWIKYISIKWRWPWGLPPGRSSLRRLVSLPDWNMQDERLIRDKFMRWSVKEENNYWKHFFLLFKVLKLVVGKKNFVAKARSTCCGRIIGVEWTVGNMFFFFFFFFFFFPSFSEMVWNGKHGLFVSFCAIYERFCFEATDQVYHAR